MFYQMINPKKELFKWGPIEFKIFYGAFFIDTLWLEVPKFYSWSWPPFLFIHQQGTATFICDDSKLRNTGEKYFKKYFLNLKNYKKQWLLWQKWFKKYRDITNKYTKIDFSKISGKKLLDLFREFYKLNIEFWLIVHVPEIANWGGEKMLRHLLEKIDKTKADEYLEILSAPVKYSFFQKEELDLLKIAKNKKSALLKQAVEAHTQKYHWILNSYGGNRILKTNYFSKKLKELLKIESAQEKIIEIQKVITNNQQRKKQLIKKLKLNKKTVLTAKQLSQSIWWQDLRKGYIWRMQHFGDKFLKEISKRTNWKFEELVWCWPKEVMKILENKKIDHQKILSRKKYYAVYLSSGNMQHLYGEKVQKLIKIYQPQITKRVKTLKGLIVSRGAPVQGIVKIIHDPFLELEKLKKDEILVTGMTSPEFIVAMRKAKAIITDHGGMTSHAAIVSRELGITCIVGTKIATKILKDGDLVEIDASKGIVKILK